MNLRSLVSNAIRRGKLQPANTRQCEVCGFGAMCYAVQSDVPLVVRPLCLKCYRGGQEGARLADMRDQPDHGADAQQHAGHGPDHAVH